MSTNKEDVVEYPENYEEMVQKLKEREDEQLQKVLAKRKAQTREELEEIAKRSIVKRQLRQVGDHKTLKNQVVLKEPKSEDVLKLREKLDEETTELAKQVLTKIPLQYQPSLTKKLKGRIKFG